MLDLEEADGRRIDIVVATKFPSYVVRHPEKRVWLVHQFRQAYELDGTELGQFGPLARGAGAPPPGAGARPHRARRGDAALRDLRERRGAARAVDGPRRRGAARIRRRRCPTGARRREGFVLSASRLDRAKRIDLLLEGAALQPGFDVVIVSDGPDRERLEALAREQGPRRPRPLRGPRRRRAARRALRDAARPSTTRRSTRTSAWGRTRRSSPASP